MKNNNLGSHTKFILLRPLIQKQGGGCSGRVWLLTAFISLFSGALFLTLFYARDYILKPSVPVVSSTVSVTGGNPPIPKSVARALVYYASQSNSTDRMSYADIKWISDILRQCSPPCNFLVFGLTHETLLWQALNSNGRTVFIDENRYYAAYFEEKYPEIEAYDVQYTTRLSEFEALISAVKRQSRNECRPVQNLLFSECKLGLNDLPNNLYEVDWDVILVDGPRGYWPEAPGRMSAIFTAGVLARSKKGGNPKTHVLVHDYNQRVDKMVSDEFLCRENLVKSEEMIGHFVVEKMDSNCFHFCRAHNST
ncbi:unnamed protein product [Cuscuta epithymum]|uniref:Polysaccharide biosynthesis domain-containing protein n=1 Tax=Cuscuta epithymum TaxID=186058 RepID=A0AAV0C3Y1_9ASTE|nr:unnamed protein product [Cuscuta epithymum]